MSAPIRSTAPARARRAAVAGLTQLWRGLRGRKSHAADRGYRGRDAYAHPQRPATAGFVVIAAFVAVLAAWAALAPISGAAIASGSLQVEGKRQAVQHPYGGVVKRLMVQEGEQVRKGQPLVLLFDAEPRAKLDVLRSERDALLAQEARLVAERDGRPEPDFSALRGRAAEAAVQQLTANELALMLARKRQFDTEADVLRQKEAQLREQITGLRGQAEGLERQHSLLEEEAKGARQLHSQGYAPKTRILALERDLAKLQAEAGLRRADVARAEQAIAQVALEIAKLERSRLSEITDQLRTSQARLAELAPRIDAAQDVLDRTVIAAPAGGAVVGLSVFTEGGVIQAGAKLLDIVPKDNPLMVEARLRIDDVNEVARGKRADVRLTSIHHTERPRISGEVVTVSADRLTDEKSGQPYYALQVRLDPADVAKARTESRMELQAGMQAEVIVTTRPRTLIGYLVGPLADEVTGAFREK